jgi:hypothetical protein
MDPKEMPADSANMVKPGPEGTRESLRAAPQGASNCNHPSVKPIGPIADSGYKQG